MELCEFIGEQGYAPYHNSNLVKYPRFQLNQNMTQHDFTGSSIMSAAPYLNTWRISLHSKSLVTSCAKNERLFPTAKHLWATICFPKCWAICICLYQHHSLTKAILICFVLHFALFQQLAVKALILIDCVPKRVCLLVINKVKSNVAIHRLYG